MKSERTVTYVKEDATSVAIEQNPLKRPRLDEIPTLQQQQQQLLRQANFPTLAMLAQVEHQMGVLVQTREMMLRRLDEMVTDKWKGVSDAPETKALMLYRGVKKDEFVCSICTRDFLPMKIADRETVSDDYLYRCEQCAVPMCWLCLFKCIELNGASKSHHSIGLACPYCQHYNCNRVLETSTYTKTATSFPFPSGYSSVAPNKVKGVKLPTSGAVTYGNTQHEKNVLSQSRMHDLHQLENEGITTSSSDESTD